MQNWAERRAITHTHTHTHLSVGVCVLWFQCRRPNLVSKTFICIYTDANIGTHGCSTVFSVSGVKIVSQWWFWSNLSVEECSDSRWPPGSGGRRKEGSWPQEGKRWPEINVFRVNICGHSEMAWEGSWKKIWWRATPQREAKRLSIMFAFFWSPKIYCCSKVCGCKTMFLKEVFYAHQCFILRDSSAKWKLGHCLLTFVSFQTC